MLRSAISSFTAELRVAQSVRRAQCFSSSGHFGSFSEKWWDIDGPMSVLHDYNYVRLPFIAKSYALLKKGYTREPEPLINERFFGDILFRHAEERSKIHLEGILGGVRILDVGCGGGILSESLAKCGAYVVGIDPSKELIRIAEHHRETDFVTFSRRFGLRDDRSRNVEYLATTLEEYATGNQADSFDIVVASEVLEHVPNVDKPTFIKTLRKLTRPGGLLVFTTPGRTLKSCLVNIILAENVFRRVPRNSHNYGLFISPDGLCRLAGECILREIYADFMKALNTLQCAFCSMDLVFLMQLATPYKDAVRRVLLVFFCPNHAETNEGWYIQRYTVGVTDTAHTTKVSAFDEMNALSSWVSDLELYPSKKNDTASAVTDSFTTTTVDNDSAHRIMVEEDFVTPSAPQPVDGDTERLFAAYKQRSREDVDEEDHLDIDTIEYHCDPDASSDSSADESDVARVDPMLLEFQQYVSMRPKSVLRYDWSGRPLVLESGFHFGSHCFGCGGECVFEFQLLPAFMKHM
ncbi:Ubiquinone biosynthesis O-methyltransferase [Babesia sp. Xinjiang]|uniref:Ubiquinone biosynthesis O-methyltransferase n=1 Tax=Babesia sp. Xinjiang TaxID=462227 RepID=UPI000A249BF7|nr:Ubiquinone biosynthesis O-methyltransferase [Babesia sp. Xinjiang]ORM40837.1 Ubiquinone biosynthesis O-methyltransferase [Babesia sp. Xinjiang]